MVPVAFKDVTEDGKLVVGDVFLDTTLKNLTAQMSDNPHGSCRSGCFKILRCAQDDSKTRAFQR